MLPAIKAHITISKINNIDKASTEYILFLKLPFRNEYRMAEVNNMEIMLCNEDISYPSAKKTALHIKINERKTKIVNEVKKLMREIFCLENMPPSRNNPLFINQDIIIILN